VPHVEDATEGTTLLTALVELWPSYLSYPLSFLVVGTMWPTTTTDLSSWPTTTTT
jgi:uncharacterized membrane protein